MLRELTAKIHEGNVARGFWEQNNLRQKLTLIVTEVVEAFEEVRTGRPYAWITSGEKSPYAVEIDKNNFVENKDGVLTFIKPEGELFELADVVIRCLDLAGYHKLDLSGRSKITKHDANSTDFYFNLIRDLTSEENGLWFVLQRTVAMIEWYCRQNEWDLWTAVEIKVAYNETRPFKHGKKF